MQKTILITGSTDGLGFETAKKLVAQGHAVLIHGRSPEKLKHAESMLSELVDNGRVESYLADLTRMADIKAFAKSVVERHATIDVLINNAGIYKTPEPITQDGFDVRFLVNTIAPYLLTQKLMPLLSVSARVINLASAAQSPVDLDALAGRIKLFDDFEVYAQSKLALTMWSRGMAQSIKDSGPIIIAVNPGSLLATKMVKEGFGTPGKDINIGADMLTRAALSEEFEYASGQYFDNDLGQFASPHPDALVSEKCEAVVRIIEAVLAK